MPSNLTIRNLDEDIRQRLQMRAAEHGRSVEEEARDILRRVMSESTPPRNLAAAIRARLASSDRVDLELPAREPMPRQAAVATRNTADFSGCGIEVIDPWQQ